MSKFEVRLTGDRPALIQGVTMNPPSLLKETDSPAEALGALNLHDRAKCFDTQGEQISREELCELIQAQNRSREEETEQLRRAQIGQHGPAVDEGNQNATQPPSNQQVGAEKLAGMFQETEKPKAPQPSKEMSRPEPSQKAPMTSKEEGQSSSEGGDATEDSGSSSESASVESQESETGELLEQHEAEEAQATEEQASQGEPEEASVQEATEAEAEEPYPIEEQEESESVPPAGLVLKEGDAFPAYNKGAAVLQAFAESYGVSSEVLWQQGGYKDAYTWLNALFNL